MNEPEQHKPVTISSEAGTPDSSVAPAAPPAPAFSAWPLWVVGLSLSAVVASGFQIGLGVRDRGFFLIVVCFATVTVAAWLDAATRRIPNSLTYPAILIGLAVSLLIVPAVELFGLPDIAVWFGTPGLQDGLLGFALCAVIGVVSFMAGGLGGGDTKLLAALGAMLGFSDSVPVLFNALVIAALIGVTNWAVKGELVARVQVVALNLLSIVMSKGGRGEDAGERPKAYPFSRSEAPFGVALLAGLVLAQFVALHRLVLGVL